MESDEEENERRLKKFRFLFHGRFTDEEARTVFEHVNWDVNEAVNFVMKSIASEVRNVTGKSEETVKTMKTDPAIIDQLQNGIKQETRQFGCELCDHAWWRKVPVRKPVSKCRRCQKKYDPIPKDLEWGWATYHCECGKEFGGSGQRCNSAPCFDCGESVFPFSIRPFHKRRGRRSRQKHRCDAPDCTGPASVPIHDVDPDRVYDDGTTNRGPGESSADDVLRQDETIYIRDSNTSTQTSQRGFQLKPSRKSANNTCVSSIAREGKKRVIYPSEPHISTGSTIGTFLSQSDDITSYMPSLPSIPEGRP